MDPGVGTPYGHRALSRGSGPPTRRVAPGGRCRAVWKLSRRGRVRPQRACRGRRAGAGRFQLPRPADPVRQVLCLSRPGRPRAQGRFESAHQGRGLCGAGHGPARSGAGQRPQERTRPPHPQHRSGGDDAAARVAPDPERHREGHAGALDRAGRGVDPALGLRRPEEGGAADRPGHRVGQQSDRRVRARRPSRHRPAADAGSLARNADPARLD